MRGRSPLPLHSVGARMMLPFLMLAAMLLAACSSPLPPDRADYAGNWQSPEMALLILQDGSVSYKRLKGGATTSVSGPMKEFVGDDFVVGIGFLTTTFEVSEAPHVIDGRWQMVVDGVRLTRAP